MEPSLPLLQFVPGLPHALRLLLHRVRGICRVTKGTSFSHPEIKWLDWPLNEAPAVRASVREPVDLLFLPQGVMARVYEAVVLLLLLALLVLGIVWVASALLHDNLARKSLYGGFECVTASLMTASYCF